ncbi:MAG: hypothetical protein K0Q60_4439, partial [Microvirga sp.]|nr:hypothetical protein [Microvirga sp.]
HPAKRPMTRTSRGPVVLGERSGEPCHSLPMLWVCNVQEITGEVQDHPLAGGRHQAPAALYSLVEIASYDRKLGTGWQMKGGVSW